MLDLYGGSGNLSLALAGSATEIHCVDLNIAEGNETYPENISFHQSAVKTWLERRSIKINTKKHTKNNTSEDAQSWLAIIDPPRSGLDKDGEVIIRCLKKMNVTTVILVGCKTDPWSRDVEKFISQGWVLEKGAVFDFFPQTYHVESAAMLRRKP